MLQSVNVPLWLFVLILLFAAVTFASHFLFPSVRWFFRRRLERAVAQLNERLSTPIQPFKLARRHDMIQRLSYDSEVFAEVRATAAKEDIPEEVAFERAQRYAREIVPAFSAAAYFGFAIRAARWLSNMLYDVRMSPDNEDVLQSLPRDATVIFVMNHRSNMDYVLVTYLVAERSALSYAVGEWARIWPLRTLIRSMGAYFIRRKSRGTLYRKVLARYVQLATAGGVAQALFPEGGLSLDGQLAPPKLGILNYIVDGASEASGDVIFVPVALNYDRVLEDRVLIEAGQAQTRRFRASIPTILQFILRQIGKRLRGKFQKFGCAAVGFGRPLHHSDFSGDTEALGAELMRRVETAMPVLPVPLVAAALLDAGGPMRHDALIEAVAQRITEIDIRHLHPDTEPAAVVEDGLAVCRLRHLVIETDGTIAVSEAERDLLRFYAASLPHHIYADAAQ